MRNKWESIIFCKECRLEPNHFIFRSVTKKAKERYNSWKKIVYNSFDGNLPNIWKHLFEKKRFLFMANSQELPLVGLYEIVDINKIENPIVIMITSFDSINLSATVDLICVEKEFSKKSPVLSGRLLIQLANIIDNIFLELAPIYAYTMVLEDNRSLSNLLKKFSCKHRGILPYYILIESNDLTIRKGVDIWDKLYK